MVLARPRWRKVIADLWTNRTRSVLVILSIAVGLFAIGLIDTLRVVIPSAMEQGYRSTNPANIQLIMSDFDDDLVDQIAKMDGVQSVLGVRTFTVRVQNDQGIWKSIQIKAISDPESMSVDRPYLLQGTWPPAENEMAVDTYKFSDLGINLGQSVKLELASGDSREVPVTAIIKDQTIGASGIGGGFFVAPIQGYIDRSSLEWFEQTDAYNLLYVTLADGGTNIDTIRELSNQVKNEVEDSGYVVYTTILNRSIDHPNHSYVEAITGILLVLGALVLFLSSSLISNTLTALLKQQTQQIGMMKTIGARRNQIIGLYMILILCFSLIALAISLPLSRITGFLLTDFLSGILNYLAPAPYFIPEAIWLQVILALLVPQIAGIIPILQGTRVSVQQSISGVPDNPVRASSANVNIQKAGRILPRPMLLSMRNTFRQGTRLIMTFMTLALGGAIFTATFNVDASLSNHINLMGNYFLADVNLTFENQYRADKVVATGLTIPGIQHVEAWGSTQAEMIFADGSSGETIHIIAPPINSELVKPIVLEGRWLQPGDEQAVALNELFRFAFPNLKPGDTIRLKIDGKESDWLVTGFFQLAGTSGGYLAYAPYEALAKVTHTMNSSTAYRFMSATPNLSMEQQKELASRVEQVYSDAGYQVVEATGGQALNEASADGLNALSIFLMIMALLTALVGSIGLAGTMSLNVMERTREIGVLRAIGASNRSVLQLVMIEGGLIGFISWLIGSILAIPISYLLANTISFAIFSSPLTVIFTPTGFLIWLGVAMVFSLAASYFPARNAVQLTIREVLSYE
jgi:putative ABC transport system permease protein